MPPHTKTKKPMKETTKEKLKIIKKERKQKLKEKRARLMVKNLPFQATEENLRAHFEKFGDISEVTLLKKEDGKLVGCGFVQFKAVQKASKAQFHTNGKEFLGREILVYFALAKNKFEKKKEVKEEGEVEIKEEPIDSQTVEADVKNEEDSSDENLEEEEKKPRFESNDVTEGKTVFVKNVPFTATNDDLRECMKQFGPVYYALICIDKLTEHSKGTAFVKFREKEDADKALSAGTELSLLGNVLDCHRALSRGDVQQKAQTQKEENEAPKDSRNLYLVKEGVILAGSKAAEGLSSSDMSKRLQLEQYKSQMLRNLNMFISKTRLVIHNLPLAWDDKKLRILFQKYSPKNSKILEAKVMRDLQNVDASGSGKSKEYGFVTFGRHDDALATLRSLNNNPEIFSAQKRPIVAFSIENRTAIKSKQKRLEKSRQKNPLSKSYDPRVVKEDEMKKKKEAGEEPASGGFVGVAAKKGVVQKMRSRFKLKTQAKLHHENVKKEKRKQKFAKKSLSKRKEEFTKQPKQKVNKKRKNNEDDNFSKLVSDYKKKLVGAPKVKKQKWYED